MHPHDPPTQKARKLVGQRFSAMMDRSIPHIRVDYSDRRQLLTIHGQAADLHGPQGVCTCCKRQPRMTVDGDPVGQG